MKLSEEPRIPLDLSQLPIRLTDLFRQVLRAINELYEKWANDARGVSVKDFGAKGDGVTDDTAAIQSAVSAAASRRAVLYFPNGDYKVSSKITFTCDVIGSGRIVTNGLMSNTSVVGIGATYLTIDGIVIAGTAADKAANVSGIDIAQSMFGTTLRNVEVFGFAVGAFNKSFMTTFDACKITANGTNVSAYCPTGGALSEINVFNIIGGKYWGATDYSMFIGDDRFGGITGQSHGFGINIIGAACDNSTMRLGNVGNVNIVGCYFENPISAVSGMTGRSIHIEGTAGQIRSVFIKNNLFRSGKYGVFCKTEVNGIEVSDNSFNAVTTCGLYAPSDIYTGASFYRNKATGSFASGIDFHTGIRAGVDASALGRFTSDLVPSPGNQFNITATAPASAIGGARMFNPARRLLLSNGSTSAWRTYTSPKSSIAGTKSGGTITLTIPTDAAGFNAGDAVLVNATATNILRVDYDAGTVAVDEYAITGAVTLSQLATTWIGANFGDSVGVRKNTTYAQAITATLALGAFNASSVDATRIYAYKFGLTGDNNGHTLRLIAERNGSADLNIVEASDTFFRPSDDNLKSLGGATTRWSVLYAGTATINTSDARTKQQVRAVTDAEKAVAVRLKSMIRAFKFNDAVEQKGDKARIHFGVIAQEVVQAFQAEGLDPFAYALVCHDQWGDSSAVFDEGGNEIAPAVCAGDRFGIRYGELMAFIVSAL